MNAMHTQMRTHRRDRCAEILELIDQCLADVVADPSARPVRQSAPAPAPAAWPGLTRHLRW